MIPSRPGRGAHFTAPGKNEDVRQNTRGNVISGPGQLWPQNIRPVILGKGNNNLFTIDFVNYISPNAKNVVVPADPSDSALAHDLHENHTDVRPPDNLGNSHWNVNGDAYLFHFQEPINGMTRQQLEDIISPIIRFEGAKATLSSTGGDEVHTITAFMDIWMEFIPIDWDKNVTWANQPPCGATRFIQFVPSTFAPDGTIEYDYEFGAPGGLIWHLGGFDTLTAGDFITDFHDGDSPEVGIAQGHVYSNGGTNDGPLADWQYRGLAMVSPTPTRTSARFNNIPFIYKLPPCGSGPYTYERIFIRDQYAVDGAMIGSKITIVPYDWAGSSLPPFTGSPGPSGRKPTSALVTGYDASTGVFTVGNPLDPTTWWDYAPAVAEKVVQNPICPEDDENDDDDNPDEGTPSDPDTVPLTIPDSTKTDLGFIQFVYYGIAMRLLQFVDVGFEGSGVNPKVVHSTFHIDTFNTLPNFATKNVTDGSAPF